MITNVDKMNIGSPGRLGFLWLTCFLSLLWETQEGELLALLKDEQDGEDRMIQIDVSDEDLLKLMDRSDLTGPPGDANAAPLVPLKGPGWEVVVPTKSGGGMLSSLTS